MSSEEIREIIPPDFPPNVALIANIGGKTASGGKRKASTGSISPPLSEDVHRVADMSDQFLVEGEAGLLPSNLSNTPSPPVSCASPVEMFSPIGKKRLIESEYLSMLLERLRSTWKKFTV